MEELPGHYKNIISDEYNCTALAVAYASTTRRLIAVQVFGYTSTKTSQVYRSAKTKKAISDLLGGDVELRSKRELIEKFIAEHLLKISDADSIPDEFEKYWEEQKVLALAKICDEEH